MKHLDKCKKTHNDISLKQYSFGVNEVRNCPKCGVRTEKSTGCNHMTCERCMC